MLYRAVRGEMDLDMLPAHPAAAGKRFAYPRCTGPEEGMKYRHDPEWWEYRVKETEKRVQADDDMPPLIVHYADGEFELNDGNHRHKAYENLGIDKAWAVVWITEDAELEDFMAKYGEYVKNCRIIRR